MTRLAAFRHAPSNEARLGWTATLVSTSPKRLGGPVPRVPEQCCVACIGALEGHFQHAVFELPRSLSESQSSKLMFSYWHILIRFAMLANSVLFAC